MLACSRTKLESDDNVIIQILNFRSKYGPTTCAHLQNKTATSRQEQERLCLLCLVERQEQVKEQKMVCHRCTRIGPNMWNTLQQRTRCFPLRQHRMMKLNDLI